jgi:carbamoyltransferase
MNILGLHFGHDASVSVIKDGKLIVNLYRERHNRIKHAATLDIGLVDQALRTSNLKITDIDYSAVTSTQCYEIITDDPSNFSIQYENSTLNNIPSSLRDLLKKENITIDKLCNGSAFLDGIFNQASEYHRNLFPEWKEKVIEDFLALPYLSDYIDFPQIWGLPLTLEEMSQTNYEFFKDNEFARQGFHYPLTLNFRNRKIPGFIIQHHACHAASVYYLSKVNNAVIMTHDGAFYKFGHNNGMYYYGDQHKIFPITPHHLAIGDFYDQVCAFLGFDLFGAAGKLMGLAPYGKPIFFDKKFVGNSYNYLKNNLGESPSQAWINHCLQMAKMMNYDFSSLSKLDKITDRINADIAASTQKIFEETILLASQSLHRLMFGVGINTKNLCFAGGVALNCPANSKLYRDSPFENILIEPNCDDSGLAVGAAFYAYYNILDNSLVSLPEGNLVKPYYGDQYSAEAIEAIIVKFSQSSQIKFDKIDDVSKTAALDLMGNKILGWFEGKSEAGPRALGHRSILADARQKENWIRVNDVKKREHWRPFVPACLESEVNKWFIGCPEKSPYMLFTGYVTSQAVPAITHIDGSARIQSVNESCGNFFNLLKDFYELTGVPILLNTSFNGPGEPIVETALDALNFLVKTDLDVLYIYDYRITRK